MAWNSFSSKAFFLPLHHPSSDKYASVHIHSWSNTIKTSFLSTDHSWMHQAFIGFKVIFFNSLTYQICIINKLPNRFIETRGMRLIFKIGMKPTMHFFLLFAVCKRKAYRIQFFLGRYNDDETQYDCERNQCHFSISWNNNDYYMCK